MLKYEYTKRIVYNKIHYLIIFAVILTGCGETVVRPEFESELTDTLTINNTLIVQDTFYVKDTLEVRPGFSYRKVRYLAYSDTGDCHIHLFTDEYVNLDFNLSPCAFDTVLFYKDSVYKKEFVVLQVDPAYGTKEFDIQTLDAFIYIDDELKDSAMRLPGEQGIKITERLN